MARVVWLIFLAVIFAGMSSGACAQAVERTSADSCRVIEAAYTAAISARNAVSPVNVQIGATALRLADYEPEFRENWPLTAAEYDRFVELEKLAPTAGFKPQCIWRGQPRRAPYGAKEATVSFTRPVFTVDRKMAIVEVAFHEGYFGHGMMCVARRFGLRWSARCFSSWES